MVTFFVCVGILSQLLVYDVSVMLPPEPQEKIVLLALSRRALGGVLSGLGATFYDDVCVVRITGA